MLKKLKTWAKHLKNQLKILYFAYRDDRVPLLPKIFVGFIVAYAFSPIDLIPDFIPVLGYLDEVILLPIGINLALRMIPTEVLEEYKTKGTSLESKPKNWIAGTVIIVIWLLFTTWLFIELFYR